LVPAHQWLYTPFDRAVGHYRRYTIDRFHSITPTTLRLESARYLDSVGLIASLGNRMLLGQSVPTAGQIAFWDKVMVRISKVLDPAFGYRLGKSLVGIWRKCADGRGDLLEQGR